MNDHIGHFSIWGDFEVGEITQALGLAPSCVYPKGEPLDGTDHLALVSTWDLYCPIEGGVTIQEQVDSLLSLLWSRAEIVRVLSARYKAHMNVTADMIDGNSVLSLTPKTMQRLASLNVTLNCFYVSGEVESGD